MTKTNFGGDRRGFVEMIHNLVVVDQVVVDVLGLQRPFEVKARRIRVFVFNPTSLLQRFFYVGITTCANEHFLIFVKTHLLFPLHKVYDVGEG